MKEKDGMIFVLPEDFDAFIAANRAFVDSIKGEPHPLKTIKLYRKMMGEMRGRFDDMLVEWKGRRDFDTFDNFRRYTGSMGLWASSMDLLFCLCDAPQTFIIGNDLGELLADTDLRGGERRDIRLPFRTIYISLPPNKFSIWAGRGANKVKQPLEGAYVTTDRATLAGPEEDGAYWMIFLLIGRPEDGLVSHESYFSAPVFVNDDNVEAAVSRATERSRQKHALDEIQTIIQFPEMVRWILNCILYINSEGAELSRGWFHENVAQTMKKAKGGRKRQIRHTLEMTSSEVTWVGRSIKIDKLHHEGEPRGPLDGDRLSPRLHRVRGFWRRQVCGEGRTNRKLIWVRPFLRGTGREVVEKMYQVE